MHAPAATVDERCCCCRDRVASYSATTQYDQLMGATYDDSHVFERGGEIEPQAAGACNAPVLKVSVKDPVKKVRLNLRHPYEERSAFLTKGLPR